MRKLLIILTATFISFSVLADHHNSSAATEVKNASEAFNQAYETNDVEGYFNHYTDDAMLYFYGDRWEVATHDAISPLASLLIGSSSNGSQGNSLSSYNVYHWFSMSL